MREEGKSGKLISASYKSRTIELELDFDMDALPLLNVGIVY